MAALFLYSITAIILLSSIAWYFARRRKTWFDWDWLLCTLPTAIWFALVTRGIGSQNQDQIIELAYITGLIPTVFTLRVFILDKLFKNAKRNSIFIFAICMATPIIFRFYPPSFIN